MNRHIASMLENKWIFNAILQTYISALITKYGGRSNQSPKSPRILHVFQTDLQKNAEHILPSTQQKSHKSDYSVSSVVNPPPPSDTAGREELSALPIEIPTELRTSASQKMAWQLPKHSRAPGLDTGYFVGTKTLALAWICFSIISHQERAA